MDFRRMPDPELVEFAKNVQKRLEDHEVSCLDNALADALAAALAPLNTTFDASIAANITAETERQSIVAEKQSKKNEVLMQLTTVQTYIEATHGEKPDWELCGFNFPKTRSTVVAAAPSNLSATGTSAGINTLEFVGNNKPGAVVYEIWRRQGDTTNWGQIDTIRKQVYVDSPVTPGQYYEYKVRAVAAKNKSVFSNSAVVYGAP